MNQSSITFQVWEEEFKKHFWTPPMQNYGHYPSTAIIAFVEAFEINNNPLNATLEANLDNITYDSYGSEDSKLKRVYYFEDWDIFIMFSGTRASYDGESWDEMKEVEPTQKIINTYE